MDFGRLSHLDADSRYVVFETAESEKTFTFDDGRGGTERRTQRIIHEDLYDKNQTFLVTREKHPTPKKDHPPVPPAPPTPPTPQPKSIPKTGLPLMPLLGTPLLLGMAYRLRRR